MSGTAIYGEESYIWAELILNPSRWSCIIQSSGLGALTAKGVVFDTTSQYDIMPPADLVLLKTFLNEHNADFACVISDSVVEILTCTCDPLKSLADQFPAIPFVIGSNTMQVEMRYSGANYMRISGSTCTSQFKSGSFYSEINYWILGMPTYRQFEIQHDYTFMRIGFKATSKSRAYIADIVEEESAEGRSGKVILALALIFNYLF